MTISIFVTIKGFYKVINRVQDGGKLTVTSLFSGAGGLDFGFKQSGFDIVWANDFEIDAVKTYKFNIDKNIVHGDIRKIKETQIPNNPDVIIGGFPCQGFSIANKNRNINELTEIVKIIKTFYSVR